MVAGLLIAAADWHDGPFFGKGVDMRISIYGGSDAATVDEVVARVHAAADEGFRSFWLPQTASVDALTALAVAGREVPSIGLGTAVVPIQGRHPIPLAQQALTLADAAGEGRVTLGVGVSHKPVSEGWYGIPYKSVVGLCEEELRALDGLLGPSRRADVDGDHLSAHLELAMKIARPGLVVAALGPKMLDLAGRHSDGTVTWMTGVATLRKDVVPRLRAAAADSVASGAPCHRRDTRVRDERCPRCSRATRAGHGGHRSYGVVPRA